MFAEQRATLFVPGSFFILAMPLSSVLPVQTDFPLQSLIDTVAPPTGSALSRDVTHTSEDSLPHLKCAERFVTSVEVGTYKGSAAPRRTSPRILLSISIT